MKRGATEVHSDKAAFLFFLGKTISGPFFLRSHERASGASSGERATTPASATTAPSQRAVAERRCARSELARVPVFECGTDWSPLAEGPFFNGTLVPKIQLAILKTSKKYELASPSEAERPGELSGVAR